MNSKVARSWIAFAAVALAILQHPAWSATSAAVAPVANPCPRPAAGSVVENPPALFSSGGVLAVDFSYQTRVDAYGRTQSCFMTPDGLANPTLYVHPGDHLKINLTNNTPATPVEMQVNPPNCGASAITASSVSLHFHGTNISPTCHQDEVLHTVINSGDTFAYDLYIPPDEPPGLYWYHPHIHMHVEASLIGGADGVIVVEGIQNFLPVLAGMPQRILTIRDQEMTGNAPPPGGSVPSHDVTLNDVPISYPQLTPAIIRMAPGERQLWRVSNSSADEILDLQVQYDGVPQPLRIVALDGVPTGSQDGTRQGMIINATHVLIPTAGRAEFIVEAPGASVSSASLLTLAVNTGPDGDSDPQRTLAAIQTVAEPAAAQPAAARAGASSARDNAVPSMVGPPWKQRFEGLAAAPVTAARTLYFSENNPAEEFFITEEGATPTLFNPNDPPSIVTTQGAVEDWTIENRTREHHEFHTHQNHFLVLSQKNFTVNGTPVDHSIEGQFLDTVQVPFWDGNPNHPYPSVKVRVDFRGLDVGDFVYHCHIAEHEDHGMMAIIRVDPAPAAAAVNAARAVAVNLKPKVSVSTGVAAGR